MPQSLEKKHLLWKVGQSTTFLSATVLSGATTDVKQLGFLALAGAGLVCWSQASVVKKEITNQFNGQPDDTIGHAQKQNTVRNYVIWGHTALAAGATAMLSDLTSPLTLGVLALGSAALIANAIDNYQLLRERKSLSYSVAQRRSLSEKIEGSTPKM